MLCRCQPDQKMGAHSFTEQHSFQMSSSPPLSAQSPGSRIRLLRQAHAEAGNCSSTARHASAAAREPRHAASTPQNAHVKGSQSGQSDPWRAATPGTLGPSFDRVLASFKQRKAYSCTDHGSSAKELSRPALSRLSARLQALQAHVAAAPHAESSPRRASEEEGSMKSTAASAHGWASNPHGILQVQGSHAGETPRISGTQPGAQAQHRCNSTLRRAPAVSYAAADAPAVRTISAKVDAAARFRVPADISAEASDKVRRCRDCTGECFSESVISTWLP